MFKLCVSAKTFKLNTEIILVMAHFQMPGLEGVLCSFMQNGKLKGLKSLQNSNGFNHHQETAVQ